MLLAIRYVTIRAVTVHVPSELYTDLGQSRAILLAEEILDGLEVWTCRYREYDQLTSAHYSSRRMRSFLFYHGCVPEQPWECREQ